MVLGVLALALALAGCRASGMVFVKSSTFRIVEPNPFGTVTLPLTVKWTEGAPFRPGDRFALFLDRGSIGIGENILHLVPDSCRKVPTCSPSQYLQQRNVYVTNTTSMSLATLPSTSLTGHSTGKEDHTVVIVVLDSSGTRVGEQYASVDFVYQRHGLPSMT
ncbi:MAG TPA: hypothetical protein VFP54_06700 [Acidimicrobiales bacterium]|nr:hypothetical protein [Acidimicrobiales bacterium]